MARRDMSQAAKAASFASTPKTSCYALQQQGSISNSSDSHDDNTAEPSEKVVDVDSIGVVARHVCAPSALKRALGYEQVARLMQGGLTWLGAGVQGCVYKTHWRGAPAAVKFFVATDSAALQQSVNEAALARLLSHPHIVQVRWVGVGVVCVN